MPTSNFTVSRSRIAPTMVVLETAYGDATVPTPGTDDLQTYDSAIKAVPKADRFEFRPHASSFTRSRDLIGARWVDVNFKTLLQTSGTDGDPAVNGFTALDACAVACACTSTTGSSPDIITWAPSAIADLGSVSLYAEHHGYVHKVSGAVGNMVISGNARSGIECDVSMMGLYVVPEATGTLFDNWTGGTNLAQPCLGATVTISNGSAAVLVPSSFRFDMGVQYERIDNFADATGTEMTLVIDRNPTLELVMAMNTSGSAGITYAGWFTDWFSSGSTTHVVQMVFSSLTNKIDMSFPTAQVIEVTPQTNGGHNEIRVLYKLQHVTAETEWAIIFGTNT